MPDQRLEVTIGERVRKNLNLLSLEGKPAPAIEFADWLGARPQPLSALRGHLDQLEHDNAALRKQQHDLYTDLDARVKALSAGGAAGAPGPAAAGAGGAAVGTASAGDAAGGGGPSSKPVRR